MILESSPWKDDLLKDGALIEKYAQKSTASEYRFVLLEKKIFLTAYAMRKLVEAPAKVTDQIRSTNINCLEYPSAGTGLDEMNWHHVERHFDFGASKKSSIKVRNLFNEIIHSFVFVFINEGAEKSPISGFLVASDWKKNTRLLEISIENYVQLVQQVANSNPTYVSFKRTRDGMEIAVS